jgi:hypothetical protein
MSQVGLDTVDVSVHCGQFTFRGALGVGSTAAWLAVAVVEGVGGDGDGADQLTRGIQDGDH